MATSWPRILLVYAVGVLAAGQLGIVPPLVPALQGDLQLSLAGAGAAVSIITLVGALFGLLAGDWCEKVGHARAVSLGLAIMAAAAGLCAAANGGDLLLGARALAGVGYLLVVVAGPSLMAALSQPRHHAITLSLWSTFVPVGIATAGMASAGFAAQTEWRTAFLVDAALLAAVFIFAAVVLPRPPSRREGRRPVAWRSLRASLPLAISFFCFALLFLALAGILPAYLMESRGLAAEEAGRIVGATTACGIAGSLAAGWMMRRGLAAGRLAAVGLVASTATAALAFSSGIEMPLVVVGFAASFAIGGLVPAAVFASVPMIAPEPGAIGPTNGLVAQAGSLGSLAGPPLLALWVEWLGWPSAPFLLVLFGVAGGAAALAVPHARR